MLKSHKKTLGTVFAVCFLVANAMFAFTQVANADIPKKCTVS